MHEAPPVLSPIEFAGMQNQVILMEMDHESDHIDILDCCIKGKNNIIYSPDFHFGNREGYEFSAICTVDSVVKINNIISRLIHPVDYHIIHRIDLMDLSFGCKRKRGEQVKAWLSMMCSPKILKGSNLIVTSENTEYTIREKIASMFLNMRTKQTTRP